MKPIPLDAPVEVFYDIFARLDTRAPHLWDCVIDNAIERWKKQLREGVFKERTVFPPVSDSSQED